MNRRTNRRTDAIRELFLKEAVALNDRVLELDRLLTHLVRPDWVRMIGQELADRFRDDAPTKVLTAESAGIAPAFAAAEELGVPLLFARRRQTLLTGEDVWHERVPSFTKGVVTDLLVPRNLLSADDRVLIVDDTIAHGDTALGLVRIVENAGARLVGFAVVVEKCFQEGARRLKDRGVRVESLVRVRSLENGLELESEGE